MQAGSLQHACDEEHNPARMRQVLPKAASPSTQLELATTRLCNGATTTISAAVNTLKYAHTPCVAVSINCQAHTLNTRSHTLHEIELQPNHRLLYNELEQGICAPAQIAKSQTSRVGKETTPANRLPCRWRETGEVYTRGERQKVGLSTTPRLQLGPAANAHTERERDAGSLQAGGTNPARPRLQWHMGAVSTATQHSTAQQVHQ